MLLEATPNGRKGRNSPEVQITLYFFACLTIDVIHKYPPNKPHMFV